jgi:hypothetical protein
MQDLSGKYPARLIPTSQEAGGMVYDNSPAMTAKGSDPVTPMVTPSGAKMPFATPEVTPEDPQIPVSNQSARTKGNPVATGQKAGHGWTLSDEGPDSGGWKRV